MMAEEAIPLNAWMGRTQTGRQGPKKSISNLMLYLRNIPAIGPRLQFNDLSGNIEWQGRELRDSDYVEMRLIMEGHPFNYEANAKDVPAAVLRAAEDRLYNPVVDYLQSLTWDGRDRLDGLLAEAFGADDTKIHRAFGRMFMISAVARALRPGCQVDTMLILEGEQGIRKSTAIAVLFGAEFVNGSLISFRGNESGLAMQGVWAVDLGELSAFSSADVRTIKNFITLRQDRYRPPWGRHFITRPRRTVFVGSTNEKNFLSDPTGARRFWPVHVRKADIPTISRLRDQLWAEAVHRFHANEPWWFEKGSDLDAMARALQSERYVEDVWAPQIDGFLEDPETVARGCVLTAEVLSALSVTTERRDQKLEGRVTDHLTQRGWFKHRCRRHSYNGNWWFPPDSEVNRTRGRPKNEP